MAWINDMPDSGEFSRVRVVVDDILDDDEVSRAAGCVGYSFRQHLRGEDLGVPENITRVDGQTSFECSYDSTKCRSFHVATALETAEGYIWSGTPVRLTDRTGPRGTRLVAGLHTSADVLVNAPDTETRVYVVSVGGRVYTRFPVEVAPGASVIIERES